MKLDVVAECAVTVTNEQLYKRLAASVMKTAVSSVICLLKCGSL